MVFPRGRRRALGAAAAMPRGRRRAVDDDGAGREAAVETGRKTALDEEEDVEGGANAARERMVEEATVDREAKGRADDEEKAEAEGVEDEGSDDLRGLPKPNSSSSESVRRE